MTTADLQYLFGILRPEPDCMTRPVSEHDQPQFVAARNGCTNIPLAAAWAQEDDTILDDGFLRHAGCGPSTWIRGTDQDRRLKDSVSVYRQVRFITAPSMTTPAVTYFQSATSSFRASATIVVFLRRPPLRLTRSSNHRVSADCG